MRIISGILKGRQIRKYDIEGTRPTMDRVKESLFSIIQDKIEGKIVLDLFAGSGSLGFESISNGAKHCYFNDINAKCVELIDKMVKEFSVSDKTSISKYKYEKALEVYSDNNLEFDLIFLDPPYGLSIIEEVLENIYQKSLLSKDGIVVCEVSKPIEGFTKYTKIKEKKYGDKYIIIFCNK